MTTLQQRLLVAGIVALALLLRVAASVAMPDLRGDWGVYSLVAGNIVSGCGVSLSLQAATECVPHFGGNGLPGYPFFIASVWTLFQGTSPLLVLVCQSAVAALAIGYLAHAVLQHGKGAWGAALAGVLLAVSLPQIYWARTGMAETLTCAMEMVVLAELITAMQRQNIRVLRTGLAIAAGIFLRLDFIFFLPAVALAMFCIFQWKQALRQGLLIACVVCLPIGAWTVRNQVVQLPSLMPPAKGWMLPDGSIGPLGYLAWMKTWVVSERERGEAAYFWVDDYARIRLPARVFEGPDGAKASELVGRLRAVSGSRVPAELDAEFRELANARLAAMTVGERVTLFSRQCAALWARWFDPFFDNAGPAAAAQSTPALSPTGVYQCAAMAAFLLVLALAAWGRFSAPVGVLLAVTLVFMATKTFASVPSLFIENRYTIVVLPVMELTIALALAQFLTGRSRPPRPDGQPAQ